MSQLQEVARAAWCERSWRYRENREMDPSSLVYVNPSLDHYSNYTEPDPDPSEPSDTRPSILITFQNSASYYTSYMGGGGVRGGGPRRNNSEAHLLPQPQQSKEHPIVIMNDYPPPPPVSVTVNSRKVSCDHGHKAFTGPPVPQGPPKPPGPPMPNLPPSRRESLSTNILELPKSRRSSACPVVSRNRSPSTVSRASASSNAPPGHPHALAGHYESSTMPRKLKLRPPRPSQSMPTLTGEVELESLRDPTPSPRPSVCSSAAANSQVERRPLMMEHRSSDELEDWTPPPQPKPNWLSLNLGQEEEERKPCSQSQSVYVAEIWPSLVCILTAVLMTLIVYILVSYFYSVPHPTTRNRIAPTLHRPTPYPSPPPTPYPYPYPYIPPPYDRYPPYQYPPQPPNSKP